MTQTLETVTEMPMSPVELTERAYNVDLTPEERAPYVAAHALITAVQKSHMLSRRAYPWLSEAEKAQISSQGIYQLPGESEGDAKARAKIMDRAIFTREYAAVCAALPVDEEVKKESPESNDPPKLGRAWVPYPNHIVPVNVDPKAVRNVLHEQAIYEDMTIHKDKPGGRVSVIEAQPRRRGFGRVLGWLSFGFWSRKR